MTPRSKPRRQPAKRRQRAPDKQQLASLESCCLTDLTEEEQKAFQRVIDSLAGPSDEEFNKKFQELLKSATKAANAGKGI